MNEQETVAAARIKQSKARGFPWLLPILAAIFALYLVVNSLMANGPMITVHSLEGHGLGVGDPLRYRGVDVGTVRSIELTGDLHQVAVRLRLKPEAAGLCREGSRFWVVRPEMAVDRVEGLETIVGARYLRVSPGDLEDPERFEFTALESPPVLDVIKEGGLRIQLEASKASNLGPGTRISYRGIPVGSVLGTRLASDGGTVEIDAYIEPDYRDLVRDNTWFWNTGGLEVNVALTEGLSVEMDSLRSLIIGAIAMATPTAVGELVEDGTRFSLHESAHESVDDWRPLLNVGAPPQLAGDSSRHLSRAVLSFVSGRVIRQDSQRDGWVVNLPKGALGPADLLQSPTPTSAASLVVDGEEIELEGPLVWAHGGLGLRKVHALAAEALRLDQVRFSPELQDCLAYIPGRELPLSISHMRLRSAEEGWLVDSQVSFEDQWHGALVCGRADELFLGLLLVEEGEARIAHFMPAAWE